VVVWGGGGFTQYLPTTPNYYICGLGNKLTKRMLVTQNSSRKGVSTSRQVPLTRDLEPIIGHN